MDYGLGPQVARPVTCHLVIFLNGLQCSTRGTLTVYDPTVTGSLYSLQVRHTGDTWRVQMDAEAAIQTLPQPP